MRQCGLDPAHYYSSPGLSWYALLKKTGVELELLTDYDQNLFIEKGLRGGITMVSKRYARANNPQVPGFDQSKPKSHILYLDANNLYGWAMSQPLPTGGFEWVEDRVQLKTAIAGHPATAQRALLSRWTWNTQKSCTRCRTPIHWQYTISTGRLYLRRKHSTTGCTCCVPRATIFKGST